MTRITNLTESLYTKKGGILSSCMIFDLGKDITKGMNFYFYKFNIMDVVEITLNEGAVKICDFIHSRHGISKNIVADIDFLEGYWKSAGLMGKTFLFDTSLKTPLRYSDFQLSDKPFRNNRMELGFITQYKEDGYITSGKVSIFEHIERNRTINNSIISIYNRRGQVLKPNEVTNVGTFITCMLAGLQSGMNLSEFEDMAKDALASDLNSMRYKVDKDTMEVEPILSKIDKLRFKAFSNLIYTKESEEVTPPEFSGESINTSRLIQLGLDNFIKSIKQPTKSIKLNLDYPLAIDSAYIRLGCLFVVPKQNTDVPTLKKLFRSDNINIVMN